MEVFGDLLKGFRLRRGRNQQWLANKLGKHRNTISDWERAEYLPDDRETVLAISDALGLSKVETDELLFAANYPLERQSKNLQQASVAQFKIHFVIQYSYEKSRMGYCVLIRDKAEERASVWMAGRSMPRVGFFCSRPFSSINQRAKVLSADLTRAR